jgi:glutathione peroxidase
MYMRSRALLAGIVAMALMSTAIADDPSKDAPPALAFSMNSLEGEKVELNKYKGKVVLIVNVASKCGLTPQYEKLQQLHEDYASKGLAVVGVPCNQFGGQEPGTSEEIKSFCSSKYNVSFDLLEKVNVNDDSNKKTEACPLYKYLTSLETKPLGKGPVKWNFEKFLVDREGNVIARFGSRTEPNDPEIKKAIEKALGE